MKTRLKPLSLAIMAAMAPTVALAEQSNQQLEEVMIFGEAGETDSATKLDLTIFETPQTVTAISRLQLDEFALNNINDALDYTPGVTVEQVETGRTYYTARGFNIVNFQYDGLGIPFASGNFDGGLDTAIFEKVEVIKGAAGLITGLANPSATINFVRKRPTDELQAGTRLSFNEYGGHRLDADVSGAASDAVRARLVIASEDSESHLDRHNNRMDVAYGIVEADLSETTLLTVGHSYTKNKIDGVLWGALPLLDSNDAQVHYDVATSTAPSWTFSENENQQTFLELKQELGTDWELKVVYNQNENNSDSALFYVSGKPDPVTGLGLGGLPGFFTGTEKQKIFDIFATGSFDLAGRSHDLVVGFNYADINRTQAAAYAAGVTLGADWAQGNTVYPGPVVHSPEVNIDQIHRSYYFATKWYFTDQLSVLAGARRMDVSQKGTNYGSSADTGAEETVPYAGITYQVLDDVMLYASYSEVFTQQTWVNAAYIPLGATLGDSKEAGLKKSFNDGKSVLTLAYFEAEQSNFGVYVERDTNNVAVYKPVTYNTDGFELEFTGEVSDGLNVSAGFTTLSQDNVDGANPRPYIPSKTAKFAASYNVAGLEQLKLGAALRWQDDIKTASGLIRQDAYALLDLTANYDVSDNLSLAVKVANLGDEKYLNSLYWDQAYYGAPRNVSASVSWKY